MPRKITVQTAALAGMLFFEITTGCASAGVASTEWKDMPIIRIETLALLESFNAELLSNDSATATLERWCSAHQLAQPAKVVAERIHGQEKAPSDEVRQLLHVSAIEPIKYRRVRLHCGEHVLSEADNWYVPARLTADMNQVLDTTDTPFGRAVQELHFNRRTLSAHLLWSPLANGWEMQPSLQKHPKGPLSIPRELIQHKAVLSVPGGTPFSLVVETYINEILAFPQPPNS
jgi:chorismate-pyruvate lyase